MPEWLSETWLEELAHLTGSLPPAGPVTGSVDLAIATAPRREVHVHWAYEDGRAVVGGSGPAPDADLSLSLSAADAAGVFQGTVDPSVAFMRGRLKASGDGRLLMAFLKSTVGPAYEEWRQQAAGLGVPG